MLNTLRDNVSAVFVYNPGASIYGHKEFAYPALDTVATVTVGSMASGWRQIHEKAKRRTASVDK